MDCDKFFVAYYFQKKYGVGAARSQALFSFLLEHNIKITLIDKYFFGSKAAQYKLVWLFCLINKLIRKPSLIYMSCGPFFHLPIVVFLSYFFKHRLVVDFRDPWSLNIRTGYGKRKEYNKFKLFIAELIEKFMYKTCYRFIVCTYGMMKEYAVLFKNNKKIIVVLNGHNFSAEKLLKIEKGKKNASKYRAVCLGTFASYSNNAVKIIDHLEEEIKKIHKEYTIDFIGTDNRTIEVLKCRENIRFFEKMSYEKAISFIANADLGLLVVRNEEYEYGTKIFDYIGLGIPIYNCFRNGSHFQEYFSEYIQADVHNKKKIDLDFCGKFSRRKQFKKIINIFLEEKQ